MITSILSKEGNVDIVAGQILPLYVSFFDQLKYVPTRKVGAGKRSAGAAWFAGVHLMRITSMC